MQAEVAARCGVHRGWVYKLKARYEAEGEARFMLEMLSSSCVLLPKLESYPTRPRAPR